VRLYEAKEIVLLHAWCTKEKGGCDRDCRRVCEYVYRTRLGSEVENGNESTRWCQIINHKAIVLETESTDETDPNESNVGRYPRISTRTLIVPSTPQLPRARSCVVWHILHMHHKHKWAER
jgi:hypothetical protein